VQDAARAVGQRIIVLSAAMDAEIDAAFATLAQQRASALMVGADQFFDTRRDRITALAARHAVPVIYPFRDFVEAGGLMSYGTSFTDIARLAGMYTARVLKGGETGRPAGFASNQVRVCDQLANGKDARAGRTADSACDRRRGDRVSRGVSIDRGPFGPRQPGPNCKISNWRGSVRKVMERF
jgi:putative tryptophan/tyrosine transport system substrate-binding protein